MITSLILVFLPLIFTGVYGFYIYKTHMENTTIRLSQQILFPLKQQIEQTFHQFDSSLTPIWLHEDLQQFLNTPSEKWIDDPRKTINIRKNISDILGWQQNIKGLFIISSDNGILYDVITHPIDSEYPFYKEEFFKKSKRAKNSFISGPKEQRYMNDDLVFSITRSLRSIPSFKWKGAINLDIDADIILNFFQSVKIGKSGYIVAYDSSGRFVYHPNPSFIGEKVNSQYFTKIENQKAAGDFYILQDDIQQLITFDKSDYLGWTFVGIVPESEINQGAFEIRNAVLIVGLASLIVIFILIWRINHIALHPLFQINKAIRGLGLGDFSSKIKKTNILELQPIVTQYNRTVDQLRILTETLYTTKLKQHKNRLLKQEAELRQREAELGQLEAQINPHFLYNTLSCIQSLAELKEFHNIDRVVGLLSKLLRYSLAQYISKVKIKEELEHVRVFVEIQQIRHEDSIKVLWDIDESVLNVNITRLSIQPLVENAYFHGVEPIVGEGKIYIKIKKVTNHAGDQLCISVKDNGIGLEENKLKELNDFITKQSIEMDNIPNYKDEPLKRHSGIYNVIKRLFLVYGNDCKILIDSKKNVGTKISIYIKLKEGIK